MLLVLRDRVHRGLVMALVVVTVALSANDDDGGGGCHPGDPHRPARPTSGWL